MTLYLTRKQLSEIDDKVSEWHDSTGPESLSEYLSMSDEEYKDFVEFDIEIVPEDDLV